MNTILDFSDSTTPWMSYALLSQSGMTGFSASNLSLNGGVLEVNLRGTSNLAGNGFTLSFDQTPEPASIVLLGTGMLAMLETVRRRQRA
ncbi:MAG: PEP-CTERM sorting domain-containing protein [Acidobacteriota bacterium]